MLIDCSYFTKGSRHILNASLGSNTLPNANAEEVNEAIMAYVCQYQEEFLHLMLGAPVGNKVHTYLICLDEDEVYPKNDNFDSVCSMLREPFACFVFYHILRDANEQSTIAGLVRLKSANEYVAPVNRQVGAWNSMVRKNRVFAEWAASDECTMSGIRTDAEMTTMINNLNL